MYQLNRPFTANDVFHKTSVRVAAGLDYIFNRKGLLHMGVAYAGGFFKTDNSLETPDIQSLVLMFSSTDPGGRGTSAPGARVEIPRNNPERWERGPCHSTAKAFGQVRAGL